jgi:hypothetical protein
MFQRFEKTKVCCFWWSKRCSNDYILFHAAIVSLPYFLYPSWTRFVTYHLIILKIIVYLLLYLGNIINISLRYINVTSQNKLRRRQTQNDEGSAKKNQNGTSSMNQLDEEADLLKRKLEEEKARKRTRGPYRKSHMN